MKIENIPVTKRARLKAFLEEGFSGIPRPAMIIVPGGAYLTKSKKEKDPVALGFLVRNYQAFILNYSTLWEKNFIKEKEPIQNNEPAPYPAQVDELLLAIAYLRNHAKEYGIDPEKIFVTGLSAGGHVAASAGIYYNHPDFLQRLNLTDRETRPDGLVLCYPQLSADPLFSILQSPPDEVMAITGPYMIESAFGTRNPSQSEIDAFDLQGKVTETFPPVFVWHTVPDAITPSAATTRFVLELQEKKIPCEYFLFGSGHHGMALATPYVAGGQGDYLEKNAIWPDMADLFLRSLNEQNGKAEPADSVPD